MSDRQQPPAPLPPRARAILAAFRDAEDMPSAARVRVRRRLGAGGERRRTEPQPRRRTWPWLFVGAAAAMLLLFVLDRTLPPEKPQRTDGPSYEEAPDQARPRSTEGKAHAHAVTGSSRPPVAVPVEAVPVELEPEVRAADAPARRHGGGTRSHPAVSPVPSPADDVSEASTLDAERQLIARAWRALTSKDPDEALKVAQEHRTRFTRGVLAPERDAIEAIARCRRDSDVKIARRFLERHPRSPLADRVRAACPI